MPPTHPDPPARERRGRFHPNTKGSSVHVTISIKMVNAAFDPSDGNGPAWELGWILARLAKRLQESPDPSSKPDDKTLFDSNGNRVGFLKITD